VNNYTVFQAIYLEKKSKYIVKAEHFAAWAFELKLPSYSTIISVFAINSLAVNVIVVADVATSPIIKVVIMELAQTRLDRQTSYKANHFH